MGKKVLVLLMWISCLVACSGNKKASIADNMVYLCPMRCEGEKVYAEPRRCPVCKKSILPKATEVDKTFDIWLTTLPEKPSSVDPTVLIFKPQVVTKDTSAIEVDEVNEQNIHVTIVSGDLSWFDHQHPEFQADKTYTVQTSFPSGGNYIIFADYHPKSEDNQVERRVLNVLGREESQKTFNKKDQIVDTNGYRITLIPKSGKFISGDFNQMSVKVTKDDVVIKEFDDMMGMNGRMVIISGIGDQYLRVHPVEVDGKKYMQTRFKEAGIYRAFYQFRINGMLNTVAFTIEVEEPVS